MDVAARRPRTPGVFQSAFVAVEFLTVLRLRQPGLVEPHVLGRSQAFFPLVGLILGALVAAADWALPDDLGQAPTGWLLLTLLLVLTGGLHVDGLADSADGIFGGGTRARRLEIMRDSSIGAFGVVAIVVVLGAKAAALGAIAEPERWAALILAPALSRWACVAAIAAFPYARPEGLGAAFHVASWPLAAPFAGAVALLAAAAGLGLPGLVAWVAAAAVGLLAGAFMASRIGGLTGDSYGAVVELSETVLLLAAVAWTR